MPRRRISQPDASELAAAAVAAARRRALLSKLALLAAEAWCMVHEARG